MNETAVVQAFGGIPQEVLDDARARVTAVAQGAATLVEALRIKLTRSNGGPARAQVNAEVDGRRIRVQDEAAPGALADRLAERLRRRIAAVTDLWTPRPWPQAPGRNLPTGPAEGLPRIVRVKRPTLVWCSPDAAARTMDAMDYDIHLFTDPATETDAVVYRVGPTGYRLARTAVAAPPNRSTAPLTLSPYNAPRLTDEGAVARLAAADLPFLFFTHPESGRGRVLYRRYDGHLGLIADAA